MITRAVPVRKLPRLINFLLFPAAFILEVVARHGEASPRLCNKVIFIGKFRESSRKFAKKLIQDAAIWPYEFQKIKSKICFNLFLFVFTPRRIHSLWSLAPIWRNCFQIPNFYLWSEMVGPQCTRLLREKSLLRDSIWNLTDKVWPSGILPFQQWTTSVKN